MLFRWIPEEIHIQYNLYSLVEPDGYIYCEVIKGIYGLKQAAHLAFYHLVKTLHPTDISPFKNPLVYEKIIPNPQCLPVVLTILVSNSIQWSMRIIS